MKGIVHLLTGIGICVSSLCIAQFSPPKPIITQYGADDVASADTDNDGDLDIISVSSTTLVLFENTDGQGHFVPVVFHHGSFTNVPSIQMVDVDDDGLVDIVIEEGDIVWCRNLGDNNFGAPTPFPGTGANHWQIKFNDEDGDGDQDAIMIVAPGWLIRVENLGGGQFGPAVQLAQVNMAAKLYLFDLDGDGDRDIAATYLAGSNIFRNQGNGTYALTSTLALNGCSAFGDPVTAADLDDDGWEDFIERSGCNGQFQWRRSLGDGTFSAPVVLPTCVDLPLRIRSMDINSDGMQDLIVLTEKALQVSLGQGAGTFGATVHLSREVYGSFYRGFSFADVNGDGQLELFVADQGYARLRQFHLPGDGSLVFDQFLGDYAPRTFEFIRTGDLNGDNWPDVVRTYDYDGMVVAYPSNGAQGFGQAIILAATDTVLQRDIDLIDMDNDGDLDLIVLADSLHLFTNQGNFQFEKTYSFYSPLFDYESKLECHDLDNDGDVDILVSTNGRIYRLRNNGANTFTLLNNPLGHPLNFNTSTLQLVDLDNDGALDVLAVNPSGTLRWVHNSGGMEFGPATIITSTSAVQDTADIDMDGEVDILLSETSPYATWIRSTGPGTFAAPQPIDLSGVPGCWPRLADIDNDGDPDLILLGYTGGGSVKLNDGAGNFGAVQPLLNMEGIIGYAVEARYTDMDQDGDLDIIHSVEVVQDEPMLCWRENFLADPYHLSGTVFADMNGDGVFDESETGMASASIIATPTGYLALGNSSGEYMIYSHAGSQSVAATLADPLWNQTTSPLEYTVAPSDIQPDWTGLDFGFHPVVDTSLINPEVVLASAPCSATTSLWISTVNEGTRIEHGTITLALDSAFTFVTSAPAPATVNGNLLTWAYEDLSYFSTQVIHLSVIMPVAQAIGDTYSHAATVITLDALNETTGTFTAQLDGVVSCAYDPNDKLVSPQGYGEYGAVAIDTEHLDYTIRFQNTGNAPAVDIVLRDQLDVDVDITSLRVLGFSHAPTEIAVEPGGELVVRFNGIQLPDSGASFTGSQGFIKFRIDLLSGLAHMTQAPNTAEIYFDLNDLVMTNTTLTTLVDCDLWEPSITALASNLLEATSGDHYQWYINGTPLTGENGQTHLAIDLGDYTVVVTSAYGCEASTPPFSVTVLGIVEHERLAMVLVPNPFSDVARLFLSESLSRSESVEILDIHGRSLGSIPGTGSDVIAIDRSGLASGVYLLILKRSSGQLGSIRMVVQ